MYRILLVAKRDYLATVKTKGFFIGLIVAPLFMGGSGIAFALLKDQVDTRDKRIAIVDRSGVVTEAIRQAASTRNEREVLAKESGKKVKPAYLIEDVVPSDTGPDAQRLELSNRVRRGELYAFVDIGGDLMHPIEGRESAYVRYYARNAAFDDLRRWLQGPINDHLRKARLAEAGLDPELANDVLRWASVEAMRLVSQDAETGKIRKAVRSNEIEAVLVPLIFTVLMFLMIMMGASPLLNAVMEEKNQRIAEILLGSIHPFHLMLGKLAAGLGVALTGSTVYLAGALLVLPRMGMLGYFPLHLIPWFFLYLLTSVTMLGAIMAALGSMCTDGRDVQAMTFPAMLPVMIPMFLMMPVLKEPLSGFATWASLVPPFTPMLMLLRQGTGVGIPAWQPLVGLLGVVVFTLFTIWASSRIFRIGILMHGKKPSFKEVIRWLARG